MIMGKFNIQITGSGKRKKLVLPISVDETQANADWMAKVRKQSKTVITNIKPINEG